MIDDLFINGFVKGFTKTASPLLTEKTYDMDGSEYERKSQAILEKSYENNDEDKRPQTARQKGSGKAVKQENTNNPTTYSFGERR